MKLRALVVSLFAIPVLALSAAVAAQTPTTGSIIGTVQDNSNAVVPGAGVTVVGSDGRAQTGATDEKGQYFIGGLAPGAYTVKITAQGFTDFQATGAVVVAGQATTVDATLALSGVNTSVNVQGHGAAQVETESSAIAGTLTEKEITSVGLNGRNFTQLIALAPGVSNQTGQDEALVGVKGSVNYSVNGGRVEYNTYDVDGGDVLNASINGSQSTLIVYPSVDAISELQVLTSNYGAMYGRSASGTILATTKSGEPNFHGDLYFFLRNNHLNARNYFDETKEAPLYHKYDPGGTIGGPLYIPGVYNTNKDKTFFFVSEEYRHDREPVDFNQGVPSLAERNCALAENPNPFCLDPRANGPTHFGDFSDVCPSVTPGAAGAFAGGTAVFSRTRTNSLAPYFPDCPGLPAPFAGPEGFSTFAGNLVPIDPRSFAILNTNLIPVPNSTTGCNSSIGSCYTSAVSPLTTWREDLVRIDHSLTPTQKLTFRYIHDAWRTVVLTPQWGFIHNSFPTVENNLVGPGTSVVAHLTSTFTNNLVNDLAMAYTTDHITITNLPGPGVTSLVPPSPVANPPCQQGPTCGIGYIFDNGFGGKIPGIVLAGTNAAYGGRGFGVDSSYMPWHHSNPTYSPRDDAVLALGKHTLQFGVLAIIAQRNEINPPVGANIGDEQGIATFSNQNIRSGTGNAFSDFELGDVQTYQQDSAQGLYHQRYKIAEPYLQDDWKIHPRLTLNLGLRISLFGTYHEENLASYNWVPSQFSSLLASQVVVNPNPLPQGTSGILQFVSTGQPVPLNLNDLDPHLVNGVVRCGGTYADGHHIPDSCLTSHVFNPAPRIGFAWDPFGNGKTAVRGGYGIFYEHGTGNEANTGSLEGSPGNLSAGGVIDMTQYYPQGWGCLGNASVGCAGAHSGATYPLNLTSIPTKAVWPYVQQWSLSVQRSLPGDLLGSIAYVGSNGTHLTAELQVNQLVPVNASQNPFEPGQPLTADICSGFLNGVPINGQVISPGTPGFVNMEAACSDINTSLPVPDSLRVAGSAIAPGIGQIFSLQNVASSNYNALQVTLRRTKGPITLGLSYTYSHSIDDSSDRTSTVFVNAYDLAQNRASSDFDERHLFDLEYVYDLPLLKAVNWWRKFWTPWPDVGEKSTYSPYPASLHPKFFQGWQLTGITLYASGTPFSVLNGGSSNYISQPDNAGVAAVVGPGSYPDLVAHPSPTVAPTTAGVIGGSFGPLLGNPNRFTAPQGLTYGDVGRNFLNNPSRLNFDMALLKNWQLTESRSLQFRLETFNIFNHTQFRVYDPANPGNTGNNIINCYAGPDNLAGDPSCLAGNSFLHPIDAHRSRTLQAGMKLFF